MLKSTLNSPERSGSKRPTLPHLFKDRRSSLVVLFTEEGRGTVVRGGGNWGLGYSADGWLSCWDTRVWTPLHSGESITITVESED